MVHKAAVKKLSELYYLSRKYPVIGAEKLLNVDLAYYQEDILERLWYNKYPLLLCSRRTGKTFTTGVYLSLRALLYENIQIGITAPVFRQAQTVFEDIENKLYKNSDLFMSEVIDRPKHGNASWRIQFKNGSLIEALPLNENIRSKGYHIIFVDEYGFRHNKSMNDMLESILEPMLFTKQQGSESSKINTGNQLILSSTATFRWNDYYKKYKEYKERVEEGDDDYEIISYDFIDGLKGGKFEKKLVIEKFKSADPLTRQMEYLNQFPEDTGGFITYQLLDEKAIDHPEVIDEETGEYAEPDTQIEFEQEYDEDGIPTHKYLLSIDDADQGKDNFACAIIKIDGNVKRLVRVITRNQAFIDEKIEIIRDILRKFNIVKIVMDQRNKNIKDNLAEIYKYNDGKKGPIILDGDDKEQLKHVRNKYGKDADMEKLIKIHNFSNKTNEERARHFLSEIEKERFKIPADPVEGYKSKKEEQAYKEIKQTLFEITSIQIQTYQSVIKYRPEGNQSCDRWTVCELGCYMADEYIKSQYKRSTDDIVLGKRGGGDNNR